MIFRPEAYQKEIIQHLLTHDRAAEFVSPGLGKTACVLSALNELFLDSYIGAALIIAPLRVARLTWPNEIRKWDNFRWMKVEVLRGQKPSGKAHIYVTNFEQIPNLTSLDFCDVLVVDELTRAKNPASKRIKHLRSLLTHQRRWGLTGTPRPNSLLELHAQIRLLDDGARLSPSHAAFREAWFYPTDYMEYCWEPKEGSEEKIYAKIADIALTLRASDYLDIPDTIVEDIEVPLPDEAMKLYRTLETQLLALFGNDEVVAQNAAVLVGKLLQITGGTVYDENRKPVQVHDAKIKALKRVLALHPKENVLIVTNYIHERERVVAAIDGTDAAKWKGDIEADWNAGKMPRLVCDPRSMGHGLNLQKGGRIIVWFSPNHSRELYDQLNARLARKGQELQPLIYRLLCPGTVDDAVAETLRDRGDKQSEMLSILVNLRNLAAAKAPQTRELIST